MFDVVYETLLSEPKVLVLQLLLADGPRIQDLAERWQKTVSDPYTLALGELVRLGVAQGNLGDSVAVKEPRLLLAPVAYAFVLCLRGGADLPHALADFRRAHMSMVCELLLRDKSH